MKIICHPLNYAKSQKMSDKEKLNKMKEKQDAQEEKKKTERKTEGNEKVRNENVENDENSNSILARDLSYYDEIGASL